ncbi:glycosyltransferase family 39 protein [Pontibacter qinzhouensis]|uniref:Glycosyltransferase family 39 protein n=1 Tax=Pontibacter qinzhouensis TaxID=2603253 RepID=A0A5C8KC04_9BACT|nr:glycosyltransferase family 39 protein [Pontibacter qinzhouensis]TXK47655.1 glycosyltransferase family 39 protein [Pontibacter qinzhouensis]
MSSNSLGAGAVSDRAVLCLLWLLATGLNLNKAFHIDDTFHLEAAQWIAQHPLQPMSGYINWGGASEQMSQFNQPPLYFYAVACVGELFGYSEVPLHLFQSIFTFLCIFFFYRIAVVLHEKQALLLTCFFVLNPAFLVNQNLMVDIPLLSLQLLCMYMLLTSEQRPHWVSYSLAGVFLSIALLIKYTTLPLLVLLLVVPLLRRQYAMLLPVLIPIGVLVGWSVINVAEFGAVHILNRPANTLSFYLILRMAALFTICLGALVPYFVVLVPFLTNTPKLNPNFLTVVAIAGFFLLALATYFGLLPVKLANWLLLLVAVANGIIGIIIVCKETFRCYLQNFKLASDTTIMLLWLLGMAGFLILFAPFMATRHVLLCLPPILLLSGKALYYLPDLTKKLALLCAFTVSMLLGISDWVFADAFRKQAFAIKESLPRQVRVFTVGNWGWQWYSRKAGMIPYNEKESEPKVGDYMVIPQHIAQQDVAEQIRLVKQRTITVNSHALTFFSNAPHASLYTSYEQKNPWTFSKETVASFDVYRVAAVAE